MIRRINLKAVDHRTMNETCQKHGIAEFRLLVQRPDLWDTVLAEVGA